METTSQAFSNATEKSELTYKNLSDTVQNWTSLTIQIKILILAILIKDIGVIVEFVGTCGFSLITYFFPAVAYLMALHRFGTVRTYKKGWTTFYRVTSWVFIALGTMSVGSYIATSILKAMGKLQGGGH